jgi:hypothetical protein
MASEAETVSELIDRHAKAIRRELHSVVLATILVALAFLMLVVTSALFFGDRLNAPRGASPPAASSPS